ncbi:MAG: hypothetical protein M3O46_00120, partial [Myxococcota bacterium]|nr:hypothetical protein [Myxococcota bacterium]
MFTTRVLSRRQRDGDPPVVPAIVGRPSNQVQSGGFGVRRADAKEWRRSASAGSQRLCSIQSLLPEFVATLSNLLRRRRWGWRWRRHLGSNPGTEPHDKRADSTPQKAAKA